MLKEQRLDGVVDKKQRSIDRIKMFEPRALEMNPNGYYVAYSGGKDSQCIAELCIEAGVQFEIVHNHTTVDPPELVYHVRSEFKRYKKMGIKCSVNMPEETMWKLIVRKKTAPTRLMRYCCEVLKEGGGKGRFVITGVRWAESVNRKNNKGVFQPNKKIDGQYVYTNDNDEAKTMLKQCQTHHKVVLNPIIDWEDEDVWEYIHTRQIPYCSLYDEGFERLGCVGCPMAGKGRYKEFERWPTYKRAYIRAFGKMLKARKDAGMNHPLLDSMKDGEEVFSWWMEEKPKEKIAEGQITYL